MSITIKSDNSSDEARVDPTSKALRVTLYDPSGDSAPSGTDSLTTFALTALNTEHIQHLDNYNGVGFTITNIGHASNRIIAEQTFDTVNWIPVQITNSLTNNIIGSISVSGSYSLTFDPEK